MGLFYLYLLGKQRVRVLGRSALIRPKLSSDYGFRRLSVGILTRQSERRTDEEVMDAHKEYCWALKNDRGQVKIYSVYCNAKRGSYLPIDACVKIM